MDEKVAYIYDQKLSYKKEYLFKKPNPVYKAVEKLFVELSLDKNNAYSKNWNPPWEN